MNTQGTHKRFLYRLHEIWICQCENLTSFTPHRRRLSKPRALGADRGCLWARRPVDWLFGAAGWNVLLFYFPAKMPVVLLERPNPHWQWEHHQARGQGHLALQLELAWLFRVIMVKEAEEKERAVVMHEYDGQYYYVFLKKMRWCHREDVSVLVLNSRR